MSSNIILLLRPSRQLEKWPSTPSRFADLFESLRPSKPAGCPLGCFSAPWGPPTVERRASARVYLMDGMHPLLSCWPGETTKAPGRRSWSSLAELRTLPGQGPRGCWQEVRRAVCQVSQWAANLQAEIRMAGVLQAGSQLAANLQADFQLAATQYWFQSHKE